jgi:hypothetical protein
MSWNYRVVKSKEGDLDWYEIHEAYYDDGQSYPSVITQNPSAPAGNSIEDLKENIETMLLALEKPVLNSEDFGTS